MGYVYVYMMYMFNSTYIGLNKATTTTKKRAFQSELF